MQIIVHNALKIDLGGLGNERIFRLPANFVEFHNKSKGAVKHKDLISAFCESSSNHKKLTNQSLFHGKFWCIIEETE